MSRKFEKKYRYKYEKIDPNLRIITPLQFNKFGTACATISNEDPGNKLAEYNDTSYNIKYNHVYYESSTNEPFIVINRYFIKSDSSEAKYHPDSLRLRIQFIPTCVVRQITYWSFIYNEGIYDPYYPNLLNGRCAIGNIKYKGIYDREYKLWWEIMRRCYDPTHKLYHMFGLLGALPICQDWNTYEFFHRYFEQAYDHTFLLPDPNDPMMYYFPNWDPNREHRKFMARFPVEELPNHKPITQWMTRVPFMERAEFDYKTPGRPRKYDIEPSPELVRHVEEQSPRVKLYTLIDHDVKYTSETWSTENFDDDN